MSTRKWTLTALGLGVIAVAVLVAHELDEPPAGGRRVPASRPGLSAWEEALRAGREEARGEPSGAVADSGAAPGVADEEEIFGENDEPGGISLAWAMERARRLVELFGLGTDAGVAVTDAATDAEGGIADAGDAGPDAAEASAELLAEQEPVFCGGVQCPEGQICCNSSCGICAPPGVRCSQRLCGVPTFPESVMCGLSLCDVGELCCNPSCGTCVKPGQPCDTTPCPNAPIIPFSITCGMTICNVDEVCCNPSCGTCIRPGEPCDTTPCRWRGTFPFSVTCGMATCNVGMACCNASCGICAPPGEPCSHRLCD